jgi:uncharacterized membrane protein
MGDSKHLELLQTNIQRLAGNGFVIKGWGVTLLTAILGATLKENRADYALFGLAPILLFWLLDGYFLALERGFRIKYDVAAERVRKNEAPTFDMTPPPFALGAVLKAMFSAASWLVFVPAFLVLIGSAAIV